MGSGREQLGRSCWNQVTSGEGGTESRALCWAKIRQGLGSSACRPKGLAAPDYCLTARSLRTLALLTDGILRPQEGQRLRRGHAGPCLLAWEPPSRGWVLVCLQGRARSVGDLGWVARVREGGDGQGSQVSLLSDGLACRLGCSVPSA